MNKKPVVFKKIPALEQLKYEFPGIKALFFDMDGTLFDTEKYHEAAMLMFGSEYSIRAPAGIGPLYDLMVGKADHLVYDIIKFWEGFPKDWSLKDFVDHKNKNVLEILGKINASEYFPAETLSLLKTARKENLYLALVTSSEKIITHRLLEISKLESFFDLVLTRDDCPFHKPDPWPYIEATKLSGAKPSEIIVFEDSLVGLEAACASGVNVIKVEWFAPPDLNHGLKI